MTDVTIELLFLVLFLFILFNIALHFTLSRALKGQNFPKLILSYWLSLAFVFLLQGFAQEGHTKIILAYSASIIPICILARIAFYCLDEKFKLLPVAIAYILAVTVTPFLDGLPFPIHSAPVVSVNTFVSLIVIYATFIKHKKKAGPINIIFGALSMIGIFTNTMFGLYRMVPDTQFWGWSMSFSLYQFIASVLVSCTVFEMSKTERARLENEVEKQTRKLNEQLNYKDMLLSFISHDTSNVIQTLVLQNDMTKKSIERQNLSKAIYYLEKTKTVHDEFKVITHGLRERIMYDHADDYNRTLKVCDPRDLIYKTHLLYRGQFNSKNITLELSNNIDDEAIIVCDEIIMRYSVFANILNNMLKFTPANKKVYLEAYNDEKNIFFKIRDEGIGIQKDKLEKMFAIDKDISTVGLRGEVGTGLGMPLMKYFSESFGGEVEISSNTEEGPSQGTTFLLRFPNAFIRPEDSFSALHSSQQQPQEIQLQ
jgi:signal transduction histidine kinase